MSEKWVSQARKFCDYCKCWISDNKPSRDFHNQGAKHKKAVEDFVVSARKRGGERRKEEEAQAKMLEVINKAAEKQFLAESALNGGRTEVGGQGQKEQNIADIDNKEKSIKKEKKPPKETKVKPPPVKEVIDENTGMGDWTSVAVKKVKVNKDRQATEEGERIKQMQAKRRAEAEQVKFKTKETPDIDPDQIEDTPVATTFKRRKGNSNTRKRRTSD